MYIIIHRTFTTILTKFMKITVSCHIKIHVIMSFDRHVLGQNNWSIYLPLQRTLTSVETILVSNKVWSCLISSFSGKFVFSRMSWKVWISLLLNSNKMAIWKLPIVTKYGRFKWLNFNSAEKQIPRKNNWFGMGRLILFL